MAEYREISSDVKKYFDQIFDTHTTLGQFVQYHLICDDTQKNLISIKKAPAPFAYVMSNDILVIFNEALFDLLEEKQQELLVIEALQQLYYDPAKDVLKTVPPDVQTYAQIIKKYGIDEYQETQEIMLAAIDQLGLNEKPKKEKK